MRDKKGRFIKGAPSENKDKKLSLETKKKISLAHKGLIPWNKGIKQWENKIPPMLGKHHTKETRKKMSIARRKRIITQKTRDKLSKTLKGRKIAWNKKISKSLIGKKCPWAKNNPQVFRKGFIPWNKNKKGLQHHTEKRKQELREKWTIKGKPPNWKGGITPNYRMRLCYKEWKNCIKKILFRDNYKCLICGIFSSSKHKLEIHHIIPWRISHNDNSENLMTVCRKCHMGLEKGWKNV